MSIKVHCPVLQKLFILYLKKNLDLSKVSVFQWLYQLSPLIYRFPFPALSLSLSQFPWNLFEETGSFIL